jgi:hypothetical protein
VDANGRPIGEPVSAFESLPATRTPADDAIPSREVTAEPGDGAKTQA